MSSALGSGYVEIKPLLTSAFGEELGALLTNPLTALESGFAKLQQGVANSISSIAQGLGVGAEEAARFGTNVAAAIPQVTAVTVAALAAADVVVKLADSFEATALPVLTFQRISGATADEASRFVAVLQEFGIASQAAGTAILRMDNNFQIHQKTLEQLGVTTTDTNGKVLQGIPAFESLAQTFSQTTDQATRTDLIVQAFGTRIGSQLLPLLVQGKQGLTDLFANVPSGLIFNQQQLQAAQDFKVATETLTQSLKGLEVEAGGQIVQALTRMADGLTTIVKAADDAGNAIDSFTGKTHNGANAVTGFIENAVPFLGVLDKLGQGHQAAASAAQQLTDALNAESKATTQAEKDLETQISATDAYTTAQQTVIDDTQKIADLTTQVNDLQLNSAATTDLFTKNLDALNQANEQVASSTEKVSQAYKALQDILHPSAETVGKANLAVAEAQNNLAQANQSVLDQERQIRDTQAKSVNDPSLTDSNLRLTSARLGVTSATFALQDAEQQLHDIQNPAGTDALTTAEDNYQSALNARASAVQRAADAQKTVDTEQATRLKDLTTKTDELRTAEDKRVKDIQSIGIDAIHAYNAETALSGDLTDQVTQNVKAYIAQVDLLYPAAKGALDNITKLLDQSGLPTAASPLSSLLGPLLSGAPSPAPTPVTGAGALNAVLGPNAPSPAAGVPQVHVTVNPAAGMSETQTGQAAGAAVAWALAGRGPR